MVIFKGMQLKKSLNPNQSQCSRCRYDSLDKDSFAFLTYLTAKFGYPAINSESVKRLFPSFCALPSEIAVLFDWNLNRLPFLGQVVDLDLLLCTRFNSEHGCLLNFVPVPQFYSETDGCLQD